jgi:putative FmdB family regulatory protein
MPTYEYRCPKGHEFELFQRITDEPGAPCPQCGEPAERQLSAGAGLLFKGSGFYITDYRSDSYRKAAGSEKPSAGDATAKPKDSGSSSGGATAKSGD